MAQHGAVLVEDPDVEVRDQHEYPLRRVGPPHPDVVQPRPVPQGDGAGSVDAVPAHLGRR